MLPELRETKQGWKSGLHYIKNTELEIYYEKMLLIWYIIKTITVDVKRTYLLLSVAALQSKSKTDRFFEERFL